jgi:hypothetical protein
MDLNRRAARITAAVAATLLCACPVLGAAPPANARLVGAWSFDEGSGTHVADSSGNGDNGVISGNVSWVSGPTGSALGFDGGSGQVDVPDAPVLEPATALTVSAWVRSVGSPGPYRYILAKGADGCVASSYALYTGPTGGLEFYVSGTGGHYHRSSDTGPSVWDGTWHLVTATFDGSTIQLYLDGRAIGFSTSYPGVIDYDLPDSNDLVIGDYPRCTARSYDWAGDIGFVRIWNDALTPGEVAALMPPAGPGQPPPPGQPPTPVGPAGPHPPTTSDPGPIITGVRLVARSRAGTSVPTPEITYTDSEAASVRGTLFRARPGVWRHGRCLTGAAIRRNRHARRCTRWRLVGTFTHVDRAGHNRLDLNRAVRVKLVPGRYLIGLRPVAHGVIGRTRFARIHIGG